MDVKEVLEYNLKAMSDHLNIENLSGNVAKQEFYKGAIYTLRALLAHPVLSESPATPSNKQSTPCAHCEKGTGEHLICSDCLAALSGFEDGSP